MLVGIFIEIFDEIFIERLLSIVSRDGMFHFGLAD
jgi:hypothetical protein